MDNKIVWEYKILLTLVILIKILFIVISIYNLFESQVNACNSNHMTILNNLTCTKDIYSPLLDNSQNFTTIYLIPKDSKTNECIPNAQIIVNNKVLHKDKNGYFKYKLPNTYTPQYLDIFCNAPNYRSLRYKKKISNLSSLKDSYHLDKLISDHNHFSQYLYTTNINAYKIVILLKPFLAKVKIQFFDKNTNLSLKKQKIKVNQNIYITDNNGFITFPRVPYGYNRLVISSINYKTVNKVLLINSSEMMYKIYLDRLLLDKNNERL